MLINVLLWYLTANNTLLMLNIPLPKNLLVAQETKYLGVTIQTYLKFIIHINDKISKAKRQLGMIKRALFNVPAKAKLLAYTSLCRPQLEYAAAVWDLSLQYLIKDIKQVQINVIRFIAKLKGKDSITAACDKLNLETLAGAKTV